MLDLFWDGYEYIDFWDGYENIDIKLKDYCDIFIIKKTDMNAI